MAKKQKKSKKNDGKKAAEAKNLAEAASKSAVVDDMEPLEATAANDAAALEAETATEAAATPVNPVDRSKVLKKYVKKIILNMLMLPVLEVLKNVVICIEQMLPN